MSKYIPADRLRAEIEKRMENYNAYIEKNYSRGESIKAERDSWKWAECKSLLSFLDTLQVEELPAGLDEAAVLAHIKLEEANELSFLNIFKAGAEWMAEQGETFNAHKGAFGICFDKSIDALLDGLRDNEKVTVQIRKCDE